MGRTLWEVARKSWIVVVPVGQIWLLEVVQMLVPVKKVVTVMKMNRGQGMLLCCGDC